MAFSARALADSLPLKFSRDILPILSDHCFQCHGFDKETRKAGLRLDIREEAIAAGAIVPGDPEASELVARIMDDDEFFVMPPPDAHKPLDEEDKARLRQWIAEGAEYQPHWAYIAPERPAVPAVNAQDWVRSPVDAFILKRLEEEGIAPSPEADPATLTRRIHFDLLGLPPNPADAASEMAYEQLVDRLLASPRYGERMAIDWLDQVRYADTNGYHSDEFRSMWPYRDYVIRAFNENLPFDQFTIEQLAGDLLPEPTTDQLVASGFNRLNQITAEGGAQAKEYLAMYMADRVRAVGSVWMGTTMGCAQCHDHKFDPVSARDFYAMGAFFADIEEVGVYGGGTRFDPVLELPSPEQAERRQALQTRIASLEAALATSTPELTAAQQAWARQQRAAWARHSPLWAPVTPVAVAASQGSTFALQDDASVHVESPYPDREVMYFTLPAPDAPVEGLRLEALFHPGLSNKLSPGNGNFILTDVRVRVREGKRAARVAIEAAHADFEQPGWPVAHAIDKDRKSGWAVSGHEQPAEHAAYFVFAEPLTAPAHATVEVRLAFESDHAQHTPARLRLSYAAPNAGLDLKTFLATPAEVKDLLRAFPPFLPETAREKIAAHFRGMAPELADTREALAAAQEARDALEAEIPYTLVTVPVEPRTVRVLPRGNWMDETGEIVPPHTPEFLPPLAHEGVDATRLDLARWLMARENPLTARVIMNRLWAQFFGTGLSKVLDDLGFQGEPPSHPELLDWLAVEFIDSGWDMKHMVRLLVTSSTYRQSSARRPELLTGDPYNRLLARQGRMRLEAEVIRDNALMVAGLLSEKIGGPSVFPYQPDGYWANCNTFRGPLVYTTSEGEDQYRRGLYTVWKRSFLHPSLLAFDAPNREECVAARVVSNTPLQALVLLNDPTYLEAARALAERILLEAPGDDAGRVAWAFRMAVFREPLPAETATLMNLLANHREKFAADTRSAEALLRVGQRVTPESLAPAELAAWTSVARVVLNLHETITRS
jgi:hypothetical protein